MFITSTIARIAATAVAALVVGGSGTAAIVSGVAGSAKADADISARAEADLSAAMEAHDQAVDALAEGSAEGQAKAEALIETSTAQLEKASTELRAAVDAGSKTAVNGIAEFTRKSVELVNGIAAAVSTTANTSLEAGTRLAGAVDAQVQAARSIAGAQGQAALQALSSLTVMPPPVPTSVSVSAGASSDTTATAPPASVASSTTG
ncbi:MAG: hypothetical protein ACRD0S_09505, partial [Acidimicrobiales bacterium]